MPGRGHRHNLAGCPVIVTENVEDYRDLIQEHVTPDDVVIELGCAQGVTTQLLAQRAKEVVGIDKSEFNSKVAQARYPNLSIYNMDAFDLSSILKLNKPFTKVFIDVSGNRPVGDVVELIEKYEKVFDPQLIVVKCFPMVKLILRSKVYRKVRADTTAGSKPAEAEAEAAAAEGGGDAEDGESHSGDETGGLGDQGGASATATTLEQSPSAAAESPPCGGQNTS